MEFADERLLRGAPYLGRSSRNPGLEPGTLGFKVGPGSCRRSPSLASDRCYLLLTVDLCNSLVTERQDIAHVVVLQDDDDAVMTTRQAV